MSMRGQVLHFIQDVLITVVSFWQIRGKLALCKAKPGERISMVYARVLITNLVSQAWGCCFVGTSSGQSVF